MKDFFQAYLYWKDELIKLDGYLVNKDGQVLGTLRNSKWKEPRILKGSINQNGYHQVAVKLNGKITKVALHRIVASTFLKKPKGCCEVNHIDKNRSNNSLSNLEWTDRQGNVKHSLNELVNSKKKLRKLTNDEVKYIRKMYIPKHPNFCCRALAEKFNVSQKVIRCIINFETYKDVL